ncbi:MAG: glycosyltransferase WbuB, partial [Bacteroidales bacterium]|nr:glycosyltransferase WbuB [Bacteroidales bacterium]
MQRKIVFINQATGYLTIDIVNAFSTVFDKVALLTGNIRVQDTQLNSKTHVTKIIKYNRRGNVRKFGSWILGTLQIWFFLMTRYRDFERFYFTIPPTAYLLALHQKTRYSIAVFDLYPEALLVHRFIGHGKVCKWWAGKNRKLFGMAHKIFTLSDDMCTQIRNYSTDSDVRVIPNWSAFSSLKRIARHENKLIQNNGLHGRFIVQYSGNIGASHN